MSEAHRVETIPGQQARSYRDLHRIIAVAGAAGEMAKARAGEGARVVSVDYDVFCDDYTVLMAVPRAEESEEDAA